MKGPLPVAVVLLAAVIAFVCALLPMCAQAGSITLAEVCAGFTVSKRGDDVLVRCPGMPYATPWLTVKGCRNPSVDRAVPGRVRITCA